MKTRLLVIVGMMISTTIFAQKVVREPRKQETNGYDKMKRELSLNDDQYASIKRIDSRYFKKHETMRKEFDRKRLTEREAMHSMRMDRERDIRNVLTTEQSKKWDRYKAERKDRRHAHEIKGRKKRGYFHHGRSRNHKENSKPQR
jgi:hypothetical protein